MLRKRFTQLGLLLLLSAVTTVAIAAPPAGKGGGGNDGNLMRISFSILQPASGHSISAFRSVNSHGEAIGYSYDQGPEAALLYQSDAAGTVLVTEGNLNRLDSYISEIGQVVTVLLNSRGVRQAATWSLASDASPGYLTPKGFVSSTESMILVSSLDPSKSQ